jgi:ammonia channel protein AmtB
MLGSSPSFWAWAFRWIQRVGWLAVVYLCCQILIWLWVDPLDVPDWVGGCFIAVVGGVAALCGLECWVDSEESREQSDRTSVDGHVL